MTYRKGVTEKKLAKMHSFRGQRDSAKKRSADNSCFGYLRTHFQEIESDSYGTIWPVKSEYRYVLHELEVPAGQRGNLAQFAGQKVHVVFTSKNRNGRLTGFIRSKYNKA